MKKWSATPWQQRGRLRNCAWASSAVAIDPPAHYPLEPDVIAATVADVSGEKTDGVVLVPAFPDAGRVTIGGVHYMRGTGDAAGTLTPVSETEFAKDATFGFTTSVMANYVQEKSQGRFAAASVIVLDLHIIRAGASAENPADSARTSANAIADAIELRRFHSR